MERTRSACMQMALRVHASSTSTKATLAPKNGTGMCANVCFKDESAWLQHICLMDTKPHTIVQRDTIENKGSASRSFRHCGTNDMLRQCETTCVWYDAYYSVVNCQVSK